MNNNYLSIEIYIVKGQEYIFDYNKSGIECLNDTLMHISPLFQNSTRYEVAFKTFKNSKDKDNKFQQQIKYRNHLLHTIEYTAICKNKVKTIDENPFVKVEITCEAIKYITNLDEMAKSGIIKDIRIKKLNSQTPR
ncbi:TPA: hypothetical protein RZK16_000388 [Campylobacter coli]|nr:hypothetical protein [Campylobacter coli]